MGWFGSSSKSSTDNSSSSDLLIESFPPPSTSPSTPDISPPSSSMPPSPSEPDNLPLGPMRVAPDEAMELQKAAADFALHMRYDYKRCDLNAIRWSMVDPFAFGIVLTVAVGSALRGMGVGKATRLCGMLCASTTVMTWRTRATLHQTYEYILDCDTPLGNYLRRWLSEYREGKIPHTVDRRTGRLVTGSLTPTKYNGYGTFWPPALPPWIAAAYMEKYGGVGGVSGDGAQKKKSDLEAGGEEGVVESR